MWWVSQVATVVEIVYFKLNRDWEQFPGPNLCRKAFEAGETWDNATKFIKYWDAWR